jgi:hypothetical protein
MLCQQRVRREVGAVAARGENDDTVNLVLRAVLGLIDDASDASRCIADQTNDSRLKTKGVGTSFTVAIAHYLDE